MNEKEISYSFEDSQATILRKANKNLRKKKKKITSGTKGKILEEFPNYRITSDGRIWSLNHKKYMKPFKNILKHRPNNQPYLRIALIDKNGKRRKIMVHRLVALAFIDNPEKKPFINHISGNKFDNNIENLEWVTNQENQIHASKHNLIYKKLTDKQVRQIRNNFEGWTNQEIANYFHVSRRLIGMIKKGVRRTLCLK